MKKTLLLLGPLLGAGAHAAVDEATLRDIVGVVVTDTMVAAGADYCDEQRAPSAAALRSALAAWRARQGTEAVRQRLVSIASATADKLADGTRGFRERMAREGAAGPTCAKLLASLDTPSMDLRARHPAAYAVTNTAAAGTMPARAETPARGTSINPAQIAIRVKGSRDGKSHAEALQAAGLAGRIFVRGTVVARGEHEFIEHVRGAFQSKISVSPGMSLKAWIGREVVVSGVIKEWPISVVFLTETRLVQDASALVASGEPEEAGMRRAQVPTAAVRAAEGKGLAPAQIHGVLYHNGFYGSSYFEESTLLLKDGTAYRRDGIAPTDLDVARSRELEPQHWKHWKSDGGKVLVQDQGDDGKPAGAWHASPGVIYGPWPGSRTLDGSYTAKSFHGSLALGGMYFSSTIRLAPDGRFEWSRYSQGGSGSVASTLNGFSAGSATKSDGSGTRGSAGGGTAAVTATATTRRDDGAEHRGRYHLDGWLLELRYDSGRVERRFCYPQGDRTIVIDGTGYSREKAR